MSGDALFRAILDNPDDDSLRLVHADFLEEHGEPERAEFIRVQIELSRLPAGDPRRGPLAAREERLLAEHGESWMGKLGERVPVWDFDPAFKAAPPRGRVSRPLVDAWRFRRGFVEEVTIDTPVFL